MSIKKAGMSSASKNHYSALKIRKLSVVRGNDKISKGDCIRE